MFDISKVKFLLGKGTPKHGGMKGGYYWHVYYQETRVGKVFINFNQVSEEAQVQIFIAKKYQGNKIGRKAYLFACQNCKYERVFAHMCKGNIASKKAAEHAGFEMISGNDNQLTMVWTRCK